MPSDAIRIIHQRVESMQMARRERDRAADLVRLVRRGEVDKLHPELFADDMPKSVAANLIDTAARDTAELMAPLPALACTAGNMVTAADKARAAKKNKIASHYWEGLAVQNIRFCDAVMSYSFGAYILEPDFEKQKPRVRYESPFGAYYYHNRWGELVWYSKTTVTTVGDVAALFPEKRHQVLNAGSKTGERSLSDQVKMVLYIDKDINVTYLPECDFTVLVSVKNPLSRPPVVIAERPDVEDVPRGQYDDSVYPYLAKSIMAMYMLKAADQSVNAPWVMPNDVTEVAYGPDAVLRTENPSQVGRVSLSIPQDVFAFDQQLDTNVKEGSRYPEARTGGIKGNIITGRGVESLMGTMDTMIRTMQTVVGPALELVTSLCFEMDVALWPNEQKRIEGVMTGKPFELTYTPAKDIGESWGARVTYGFAAGQSPAQAMVALLQLRGDDQISRDTARRQLPFDIDPEEEQRAVDIQQLEDSLKQGLSAFLQALGPVTMQGGDPTQVIRAAAMAIDARQKGRPIHEAILEAFPQPEAPEPAPAGAAPPGGEPPPGEPGAELPPNIRDNGLPEGVAYGQQGMAPGGMPSVQSLMARLRGQGSAQLEATTMVKRPT